MQYSKFLLILFGFLIPYCYAGTSLFDDVSVQAGVNVSHTSETFGVGQAWLDFDRDGDLDIYVTNQLGPNHLLINQGDETFLESIDYSNLEIPSQACVGVSVADYNNDGWVDIYVNCHGDNHLFKNLSGKSFVDVTLSSGVNDTNNSQVSAWADINSDGWLDLYVVNYNNGQSSSLKGVNVANDALFLSNADGTFTNISSDLSQVNLNKPGLAVTFFDYDNDGDQDLYVVIDRWHGNVLWRNDGPAIPNCGNFWCFTDVSEQTQTNQQVYGMGIAIGDIDLDGDFDMYFSSIGEQILLLNQISQGQDIFVDVSKSSILNLNGAAGWGTMFFDYDNDSYLDAMLATYGNTVETAEKLFKGNGDGTFVDVTQSSGVSDLIFTEGIAYGDYNQDGLLDILKANRDSGYLLYENKVQDNNNWVEISLTGCGIVNRDAVGARVDLLITDGKHLMQEVSRGDARGSTHQISLHFGTGKNSVLSGSIIWPDGTVQTIGPLTANARYEYQYGTICTIFSDSFG
ncbi:MAG: CRTAC1 family protein [bacterium]